MLDVGFRSYTREARGQLPCVMTTRDPRSRPTPYPDLTGVGVSPAREPTQSLQIKLPPEDVIYRQPDREPDRDEPSRPSIAIGTHDVPGGAEGGAHGELDFEELPRDERTRVESPGARMRTPVPARPSATRPPPTPRASEEGELIGSTLGSYKIVELLGKGGMGYVFRAEHVKLGREVALKLLRADYAKRRDAVLRFFQEAKTVNRVRHRNIVDVTDFVELPDGTTFIIMELLSGQSLGKWARTGIDLPRALAVLVQICDGLAAAHHVGVVHRDLKPDNIIVVPTQDGAELVKLLDFGVAKLLNRDDEDVGFQTAAGSVIGTPAYMSPEQAGGMTVDARSDIYSLGAIMYELFCGQPMFRGRSFGEFVRKHLTEQPVPPRATTAGAQLDPHLEGLILRCLQKEPGLRFQLIGDLRDALLGFLGAMPHEWSGSPATAPAMPGSMIAAFGGSAVRSLPTYTGPASHIPSLPPQLPPLYAPTLGSQPSGVQAISGVSSGLHGYPRGYPQHLVPPTGIQHPATPWWIWLVGGIAAVGLGIGAAVWYAGSPGPSVVAAHLPTDFAGAAEPGPPPPTVAEPIEPGLPPPTVAALEVKFDSEPSGNVFAEGQPAELCHTPCSFVIDPGDGGAVTARTYLVRATGFRDAVITVDLRGARREFHAVLAPTEPTSVATPTPPHGSNTASGKRSGKRRPPEPGTATTTATTDTAATKPVTKPTGKRGPIDPTETIDPFKK